MTAPHPTDGDQPDALSNLPAGWSVVSTSGPAFFITHAVLRRPDGTEVEWTSRRQRKQLGVRATATTRLGIRTRRWGGSPQPSSWWMGALFGVGSLCFAIGSIPLYFANVSPEVDAVTFAIGSVFFTAAAFVQYRETVHATDEVVPDLARPSRRRRSLFAWRPHRIDWWASAIQLAGTLLFNVSTFAATRIDASVDHDKHLVWAPDVFGSVCFLIASGLAYAEVNRRWWPRSDGSVGWHIGALNLVGSILFGLSAFGARLVGSSGAPANVALVNGGTCLGALCFLAGAVLLPVESARDAATD